MSFDWFFGKVVKVTGEEKDHDYAGDVQIRIDSDQDDKSRLPDGKLRWARMIWPVTAAQNKGVGVGGGYLTPGTQVFGFFVDQDKQIPMILGTMATAGNYGSLRPEGSIPGTSTSVVRSFPNAVDEVSKNALGQYVKRGMLDIPDASKIMEGKPDDKKWKPKGKNPEQFGKDDGGNGPAKNADIPHLGSKIEPPSVSDMVSHVKSVNPQNLGGLPSTLGALTNLKSKLEGTVKDLIGATPFAQMQVLSSVINMNPTNFLGSLSGIMSGVTGLTQAMGGAQGALSMLQGGFFNSIPMGPLQSLATNMAIGSLRSNIPIESVSTSLGALTSGQSLTNVELGLLASSLTQMTNLGPNSQNSIQQLIVISTLTQQIETLSQNLDLSNPIANLQTNLVNGQVAEIQGIAQNLGSILGVGGQLASLASNPSALLSKVQSLVSGNVGQALGMAGQVKDVLKRDEQRLPPSSAAPKYPYNKVEQSPSGHRTETDDTPGKERIFKSHKSGSYEEYAPDGKITSHSVANRHEYTKGTRTITVDGFSDVIVKGSKIVIKGGSMIEIMGNCDLNIVGDMNMVVSENFKVTAKNITMVAQEQFYTNTKNTKHVVGQKHQTNANVIEENAKNTIRQISEGLIYTEASGGNITNKASGKVDIQADGDVVTKGAATKVQGGGAGAPPTTFK